MAKRLVIKDKYKGILFIIMAGFFFSLMTFFVRLSGDLPTMQKAFFRNAVAAVVAIILLMRTEGKFKIKKSSWPGLAARSICGTTGLICNFYAIDKLNIADANILNKLSPFFAIIASYFVLKEKANKIEWASVALAFTGALFVVKPSFHMDFLYAMVGMAGGIRDGILFQDFKLLYGFIAIFAVTLAGNLILGSFKLGFHSQPVSHSAHLWNFLGMVIVGWGSVLLGGCPLRQLILAGSGNGDSAVTVFGMMAGAAIAHNFGLAGSADSVNEAGQYVVGGIQTNGQMAVLIALAALLVISLVHLPKKEH